MNGKARAYFYRNGRELTEHPANGMELRGTDAATGRIGNVVCHKAVYVKPPRNAQAPTLHVCCDDFRGPVMAIYAVLRTD
jgi:hypothetical protein